MWELGRLPNQSGGVGHIGFDGISFLVASFGDLVDRKNCCHRNPYRVKGEESTRAYSTELSISIQRVATEALDVELPSPETKSLIWNGIDLLSTLR